MGRIRHCSKSSLQVKTSVTVDARLIDLRSSTTFPLFDSRTCFMEEEERLVVEEASFVVLAGNYRVTSCSFSLNVASSERLAVAYP